MADDPEFTVEAAGERLVFVPEFWPSDLTEERRRQYDLLNALHGREEGALSVPRSDLSGLAPERGDAVALTELLRARERAASEAYSRFVFPDSGLDGAWEIVGRDGESADRA